MLEMQATQKWLADFDTEFLAWTDDYLRRKHSYLADYTNLLAGFADVADARHWLAEESRFRHTYAAMGDYPPSLYQWSVEEVNITRIAKECPAGLTPYGYSPDGSFFGYSEQTGCSLAQSGYYFGRQRGYIAGYIAGFARAGRDRAHSAWIEPSALPALEPLPPLDDETLQAKNEREKWELLRDATILNQRNLVARETAMIERAELHEAQLTERKAELDKLLDSFGSTEEAHYRLEQVRRFRNWLSQIDGIPAGWQPGEETPYNEFMAAHPDDYQGAYQLAKPILYQVGYQVGYQDTESRLTLPFDLNWSPGETNP